MFLVVGGGVNGKFVPPTHLFEFDPPPARLLFMLPCDILATQLLLLQNYFKFEKHAVSF